MVHGTTARGIPYIYTPFLFMVLTVVYIMPSKSALPRSRADARYSRETLE